MIIGDTMKKKDIRFLIIFIVIVTFSLFYLFQSSYAKYRKQVSTGMQATIASWNIKVNNENINNKSTLTNSIIPTIDSNQYIKSGVIAPGSTGHFEVVINAEDVDVDFNYEIESEVDENTPLTDLTFTGYKIGTGDVQTFSEGNTTITGNITKNTSDTTITVYFTWNDSATNNMNNQADTEYAIDENHENTNIIVSIHFTQRSS